MSNPQQPQGRLAAALGTTPQTKEMTPFESFRKQINNPKLRSDIAAMIGKDKESVFVRVCLNAVQHNASLLDADRRTLFLGLMEAASDGLMPDGNEAVLNVYKTKDPERSKQERREVYVDVVQYLPMAYGLIQKMYEIPGVTFVDAVAVYEKDHFEYVRGDTPHIDHKPYAGDEEPGKVVAAYVVIKFKDREPKREVMFRRDIEKVKDKSKAKAGLMWGDFYDQAAIKSVIHRVFKQLPQADRLRRALAHDNKAAGLAEIEVGTVEEAGGTNLAALVDMRLETEMKDQALNGGAAAPKREEVVLDASVTERTTEKVSDAPAGAATAGNGGEGTTGTVGEPGAPEPKPLPKRGDPGTEAMKAKFLGQMESATSDEVLGIVMDDVRFYSWEPVVLAELTTAYQARRAALTA